MKRVTNVDAHVGKQLKLRRINLGLSQQELGSLLNITFQQIQKYEKGVNRISSGKLYEFSKALNIPVIYFFEGVDNDPSDKNVIDKDINYNDLNKEILVISRLLSGIESKEKKRNLVDTIKNLIKFMK
jgi:transcriptional regulator with XRE-family HTH domain